MALKLANLFGTTPEFWLNAQCYHDLYVTYQKEKENIDKVKKIAQVIVGLERVHTQPELRNIFPTQPIG